MKKNNDLDKSHSEEEFNSLRNSEGNYRSIFEHMTNPVALHKIVTDKKGKAVDYIFLEVNAAFEVLTGLKQEQVLGQLVTQVMPSIQDDPANWIERYGKVALEGDPVQFEDYGKGMEKWFSITAYCPKHGYFVAIVEDITVRKNYEASIKESEAFNRSLIKASPNSIYIYDIVEKKSIYSSEGISRILGYSDKELIEMGSSMIPDLMNPVDYERYSKEILSGYSRLKDDELVEHVYQLKHKSGKWIWLQSKESVYKRDEHGRVIHIFGVLSDVTEKITREEELKKSEENFRMLFDLSPDMYISMSPEEATILQCNKTFLEKTGYTIDEVIGSTIFDLYHEDSRPEIREIFRHFLQIGEVKDKELVLKAKDGSKIYINQNVKAVRDQDGKILYSISSLHDIGEKIQNQKKILQEKSKAQQYLNVAGVMLLSLDEHGIVQLINRKGCEVLEYEEEEIVGKNWFENFIPERVRKVVTKVVSDVFNDQVESLEYYENEIVTRSGKEKLIAWHNAVLKDDKGNITATLSSGEDITAAKLAQDELLKNQYYLKRAQEIGAIGTWELDLETNEIIWTEENYRIFGVEPGTTVDYSLFLDRVHPDEREIVNAEWNAAINGKPYDFVHRLLVDGEVKWVREKSDFQYDKSGKKIKAIGVTQDITAQKKEEEELKLAKENAEKADRLKSAFLANMSHEIRTPMNGILGFTELLRAKNLSGKKMLDYVDIIKKSGDRMLNTVNDIIEISRIETGEVSITLERVQINDQLEYLYNFFKPEASARKLQLKLNNTLTKEEGLISSDEVKINSILTNLIKNAIKYTQNGSIEVSCRIKHPFLEFSVRDTGIGIPADRQEAVFERFVQADIDDRHVHEGSGLGLSITKSYVEMLGGSIWLESKLGEGSAIYFTIKYDPVHVHNMPEAVPSGIVEPGKKISSTILVAEDDEISYSLIEDILEGDNYKLIWAKNGIEAIELLKANSSIGLVLMDLKMPQMGGLEATREIRKSNRIIPIIAVTAYAMAGDREKVLEAGCNDYIAKPIDNKVFKSTLERYIA